MEQKWGAEAACAGGRGSPARAWDLCVVRGGFSPAGGDLAGVSEPAG